MYRTGMCMCKLTGMSSPQQLSLLHLEDEQHLVVALQRLQVHAGPLALLGVAPAQLLARDRGRRPLRRQSLRRGREAGRSRREREVSCQRDEKAQRSVKLGAGSPTSRFWSLSSSSAWACRRSLMFRAFMYLDVNDEDTHTTNCNINTRTER